MPLSDLMKLLLYSQSTASLLTLVPQFYIPLVKIMGYSLAEPCLRLWDIVYS